MPKGIPKNGINKGWFKKGQSKPKNAYSWTSKNSSGCKASQWKGGKYKDLRGYIHVWNPHHPFCNCRGYILRSHFVMEKYLGRYLKSKEVVHHINSIKDDDRIKNLKLFKNHSEHIKFERKLK